MTKWFDIWLPKKVGDTLSLYITLGYGTATWGVNTTLPSIHTPTITWGSGWQNDVFLYSTVFCND